MFSLFASLASSSQFPQEEVLSRLLLLLLVLLLLLLLLVAVLVLLLLLPNDSLHRILTTFGEFIGSSSFVRLFCERPPGGDIF